MARRNPMNERYQKHTAPAGKTRKSAAAAKPKRATGAAPTQKKPSAAASRLTVMHPPTPEYTRLRRIWWGLLAGAMLLSASTWWMWRNPDLKSYGTYVLIAAYAFLGLAIWLDFARLRPLRVRYNATGGAANDTPSAKAEKTEKESD